MRFFRRPFPRIGAIVLGCLCGATAPTLLTTAEPGQWEIGRSGAAPIKLCVASIAGLAELESRGSVCTRTVIRNSRSTAEISYTCRGGDFGESVLSLITPRSIRVQSQGIAGGAPFKYTVQARRTGDCPAH